MTGKQKDRGNTRLDVCEDRDMSAHLHIASCRGCNVLTNLTNLTVCTLFLFLFAVHLHLEPTSVLKVGPGQHAISTVLMRLQCLYNLDAGVAVYAAAHNLPVVFQAIIDLVGCTAGIYFCYIVYGVLQERM